MNYSLRNDLSFCTAGDRVIFLDLRKDRYFALGADAQAIFDKLIRRADLNPADSPKLADLVKAGLLNCDNEGSAVQPCLRPPQPVASALETPPARSSFADLLLVLWALLAASTALKFRSLLDVVQIIERRKAHAARNKAGASPEDPAALAALAALAAAFQRISLFWPTHEHCLLHSVAMMFCLTRRGHSPSLVFGVTARPFSAHCWVQEGEIVVTDTLDNVRNYTPIRVV